MVMPAMPVEPDQAVVKRRREHRLFGVPQDLTLPLISLFTGRGFDAVIQETFESGPQRIEDLWLRQIPQAHCLYILADVHLDSGNCL